MAALLAAERAALAEVARAAIQAVDGFVRDLGGVQARAFRLETSLVDPIARARHRGRSAALLSMGAEWEVIRRALIDAGANPFEVPLMLPRGRDPQDLGPAIVAAKQVADLYATKAAKAVTAADGRSVSGKSLLPVHAIEEAPATQTATAFAEQRRETEETLARTQRGTTWLPLVAKMWDATLDVRTCAVCRDMEGQIRLLGLSFEGGRLPASVHRRCRCIQVLILAPIYLGRKDQPEAA